MCLRVLAVLFLPSSRLRELFDSRAETLLGAAQRVFTMSARGVPPFPSPVPEGFHTPDQTVSIRGHESAAERVAMSIDISAVSVNVLLSSSEVVCFALV